jgi:hypothetical protein
VRTRSLIIETIVVGSIASVAMTCLRFEEYRCRSSSDCNASAGGECEMGSCSYPDPDCSSGRRWSEHALKSAGRCTEAAASEAEATASTAEVESSSDEGSTT